MELGFEKYDDYKLSVAELEFWVYFTSECEI